MSKRSGPIIGTVPCPIAACEATCSVRQFQPRYASDQRRRKAGLFYFDCPTHGRFGFDANPAMQEHVLEHITWAKDAPPHTTASAEGPQPEGRAAAATAPAPSAGPPAPTQAVKASTPASTCPGKQTGTRTQTPAKRWWEDLP